MNKQKLIELRCKAWGITEDEYYCNQCSDFSLEDMARAYRRGKNKGARDKAIQNVGFYQKQMQDIYDKKNKQIAELEEQIEKLIDFVLSKTECCDVCPITDTCNNSEGTCHYVGILSKGEEAVTREWLMQFISKEIKEK